MATQRATEGRKVKKTPRATEVHEVRSTPRGGRRPTRRPRPPLRTSASPLPSSSPPSALGSTLPTTRRKSPHDNDDANVFAKRGFANPFDSIPLGGSTDGGSRQSAAVQLLALGRVQDIYRAAGSGSMLSSGFALLTAFTMTLNGMLGLFRVMQQAH
eukprot:6174169-Pleurochrysis_carterae.AAC.1